ELRQRLREQLFPASLLVDRLAAVGAPTSPEQIGMTPARLRASYRKAYHLRRRFTVLDLAVRTGTLDLALERLSPAS
ncbi:MAG: Glycerol-phosphate dehydrogenase, partial [Armatimonadetes bacterium]|nr:Glycerol-phosphate dehydrogenase [Armatimonadota bacterium]